MIGRRHKLLVAGLALFAWSPCGAALAKDAPRHSQRARPPKWSADVLDAFFDDARTKLVGTRPDYRADHVAKSQDKSLDDAGRTPPATWSKLIDPQTIETEVKRLTLAIGEAVTTPATFKGGAFEDCRRDFSELALLFAVAAEYDGDVRWKDAAPALRDLFARAGRNCKVGTDQTFNEAAQRKQDLADLVAGARPQLPNPEPAGEWSSFADRPPLMQRLNVAHQDRLAKWLANEKQFQKNAAEVRHEAQIMAVIADVVGRTGYDYADDEQYAQLIQALRQAAGDIAAAVETENFDQAQKAINQATKSCADCHDLYRG